MVFRSISLQASGELWVESAFLVPKESQLRKERKEILDFFFNDDEGEMLEYDFLVEKLWPQFTA